MNLFFKNSLPEDSSNYQSHSLQLKSFDGFSESVKSSNQKEDQATKLRRRSKKDKIGRNHVCGCGKKYLSYPALYTHIKTKHNGLAPEGTKAITNSKTKRGRPKKNDFKEDYSDSNMESSNNGNFTMTQKNEFIDFSREELTKSDLLVMGTVDESCEGKCDPKGYYLAKNQNQTHPFLNVFEKLESGDKTFSKINCDIIFGIFLYSVSRIVSLKFYKIFCLFFNHLRNCLNTYGYQIMNEQLEKNDIILGKNENNKNNEVYCEVEGPENLPLIGNFFILEYLVNKSKFFDQKLAIGIFLDFVKWMNKNNHCEKRIFFDNFKIIEENE